MRERIISNEMLMNLDHINIERVSQIAELANVLKQTRDQNSHVTLECLAGVIRSVLGGDTDILVKELQLQQEVRSLV